MSTDKISNDPAEAGEEVYAACLPLLKGVYEATLKPEDAPAYFAAFLSSLMGGMARAMGPDKAYACACGVLEAYVRAVPELMQKERERKGPNQ